MATTQARGITKGVQPRIAYALMATLVAGRWWAVLIVAVLTLGSLLWAFEHRSPDALWLCVSLTYTTVVACVLSLIEDASGFFSMSCTPWKRSNRR